MSIHTMGSAPAGITLTNEQRTHYSLQLLNRLQDDIVFDQFGMKEDLPKNMGQKIQKRRMEKLTLSQTPTALTEGIPNDPDEVAISKVEITPAQYGIWLKFTDVALLQSIDNLTIEFLRLIKEKAASTNEIVIRNPLCTGTQILYGGGGASRDALVIANKASVADIKKLATLARRKNAIGFGGDKAFVLMVHPDQFHDIKNDSAWTDIIKYRDPDKFYNGEVGKIDNVRIVTSNLVQVLSGAGAATTAGARYTGSNCDVYQGLLLTAEAYMEISMGGNSGNTPDVYSQVPGQQRTISDPYGQQGFSAVQFWQACGIVDDNRIIRYETTASGF